MNKTLLIIASCLIVVATGMFFVANTVIRKDGFPAASAQTIGGEEVEKITNAGPVVIDFVGDSIGIGAGSVPRVKQALTNRIMVRQPNWFIRNFSTGAASIAANVGFVHSVDPASLFTFWPQNVVILLGVNDYNASSPSSTFVQKYTTFVTSLKNSFLKTKVICVTPIWEKGEEKPNQQGLTLENYRSLIRNVCNSSAAPVVEGLDMVPQRDNLYIDGLHLNTQGYMHYAKNLGKALEAYFPN